VIEVSVRDVDLVRRTIHEHVGRPAEEFGVCVAASQTGSADLQEKSAFGTELEHLVVIRSVARDPDIAVVVDEDAVLVWRPFVAGAANHRIETRGRHTRGRAAPRAKHVPVGVEFHHGRCRTAAHRTAELQPTLVVSEAAGALDEPDVVLRVYGDPGDLPEQPIVGQRLRPEWIDFESRCDRPPGWSRHGLLRDRLRASHRDD
jgi:hypothetical protein